MFSLYFLYSTLLSALKVPLNPGETSMQIGLKNTRDNAY